MLYTKFKGHQPAGFGEEDFWRVFTIYGHGSHVGHMTRIIWTNSFHQPNEAPYEIWLYFAQFLRGCSKSVDDGQTDDDGQTTEPAFIISSPMSLMAQVS